MTRVLVTWIMAALYVAAILIIMIAEDYGSRGLAEQRGTDYSALAPVWTKEQTEGAEQ